MFSGEKKEEIIRRKCPIMGVETQLVKIEGDRWMCMPEGRCAVVNAGETSETTDNFMECHPLGKR